MSKEKQIFKKQYHNNSRPLLLLEINEIPWRVLDLYGNNGKFPHLKKFLSDSTNIVTKTSDKGHLSPWVTWPTVHRGINDELHGIKDIGQDPATFKGSPIWEEYRKKGYSIGVWGPFQSWPPINPGENGFYLPDTFAPDGAAYPNSLSLFQSLNLMLVKQNALVRSSRIGRINFNIVKSLFFLLNRLSFKTKMSLMAQLIKERVNPRFSNYRSVFQCVISWEIFKTYYMSQAPLPFANFFTNHVAGVLHRFWEDVFPEDVPQNQRRPDLGQNKIFVDFAMEVLDRILADVQEYREKYPDLSIAFISSMGLAYHPHDSQNVDAIWEHPHKLMNIIGFSENMYQINLAMHPQKSFQFNSIDDLSSFVNCLNQINAENNQEIFAISANGLTVNVTTQIKAGLDLDNLMVDGKKYNLFDFGFVYHQVDKLSSYHVPEGVFLLQDSVMRKNDSIQDIPLVLETNQIKSFLLNRFSEA